MKFFICIRPGRQSGYVQAFSPDLPGVSAVGRTEHEALYKINERLAAQLGSTVSRPLEEARCVEAECRPEPGNGKEF